MLTLEGIVCPICGAPLELGAKKCPICGEEFPEGVSESVLYKRALAEFMKIPGIGEGRARRIYDSGIKSLADLKRATERGEIRGVGKKVGAAIREELSEEKLKKSGLFICSNCGAFMSASAEKCPNCGAIVVEEEESTDVESTTESVEEKETASGLYLCPICGAFVSEAATYCPHCGTILAEEGEKAESEVSLVDSDVDLGVEGEPVAFGPLRVCKHCGGFIKESEATCPVCGTEIGEKDLLRVDIGELLMPEAEENGTDMFKKALGVKGELLPVVEEEKGGELLLCPSCGAFVSDAAATCSICGYRLDKKVPDYSAPPLLSAESAEAEKGILLCPSCGAFVAEDAKRCAICGSDLEKKVEVAAKEGKAAEGEKIDYVEEFKKALGIKGELLPAVEEEKGGELLLCPVCGAFVSESATACPICGYAMKEGEEMATGEPAEGAAAAEEATSFEEGEGLGSIAGAEVKEIEGESVEGAKTQEEVEKSKEALYEEIFKKSMKESTEALAAKEEAKPRAAAAGAASPPVVVRPKKVKRITAVKPATKVAEAAKTAKYATKPATVRRPVAATSPKLPLKALPERVAAKKRAPSVRPKRQIVSAQKRTAWPTARHVGRRTAVATATAIPLVRRKIYVSPLEDWKRHRELAIKTSAIAFAFAGAEFLLIRGKPMDVLLAFYLGLFIMMAFYMSIGAILLFTGVRLIRFELKDKKRLALFAAAVALVLFVPAHWYAGTLTGLGNTLLYVDLLVGVSGISLAIYLAVGMHGRVEHLITWFSATLLFFMLSVERLARFNPAVDGYAYPVYYLPAMGTILLLTSYIQYAGERLIKLGVEEKVTIAHHEYVRNNLESAKKMYEEAAKVLPDDFFSEEPLVGRASTLLRLGRLEDALRDIEKAIRINPNNEVAWNVRALILSKRGNMNEALHSFNRALEINPKYEVAWNNKGNLLARLGRYEEAIECYNTALKIEPKYKDAWINKGYVLVKLGRYDDAVQCADMARKYITA